MVVHNNVCLVDTNRLRTPRAMKSVSAVSCSSCSYCDPISVKGAPYLVACLGTGRLVFGMIPGCSHEVYGTAAAATMPGLLVRWPIPESLHARAGADSKVTGGCAAELQRNAIAAIVNVSCHRHRARSYHFVIAVRRATEAESAA